MWFDTLLDTGKHWISIIYAQICVKCYQKFDKVLKWNEAESFCQTKGGHLASVHSDGENDFIFNISGFATWIGGNFNYTEEMWTWTDGSAFDFRPSGFPCPTCPPTGDTQGPCTTLWHFPGWNYATCSPGFWATKFVCQNEPDPGKFTFIVRCLRCKIIYISLNLLGSILTSKIESKILMS